MRWSVLVAVGFVSSLGLVAPRGVGADEPTLLADRWDAVRIGGAPAGHGHTVVRRVVGADGVQVETTSEGRMEMARLGATLTVEESSTTVEREDGTLVSLRKRSKMSGTETLVEVVVRDGVATIATTTMGARREAKVPVPAGTVGPWRAERLVAEAGFSPGTKTVVRLFQVDLGGPVVATSTVVGPEEVEDADGTKAKRVRVDATLDVMPLTTSSWVTPDGDPVATRTDVAGMRIETFRTTQARALERGGGKPAEVFAPTLISTRHLVPHARVLDGALLRVRSRTPDRPLPPLADERQVVERRDADGSVLVRVARVVPPPGASGTRPLVAPGADVAPFLAATSMLQADDAGVRAAAAEAVGAETNAWRAAQAIETWVHRAIDKKTLDVGFASAAEVCRDRQGDCTEHAVLVAAMCRAAGIPSRVVMGLEYLTGIFGGHAWAEVWVEGRWYALDATLGYGFADPLHLTLGRMALAEGTYGGEFTTLVAGLSHLDVDVVETTVGGTTTRFDDASVRTDGGRYVNAAWGVSVTPPTGWTIEVRGPAEGLSPRLATWTAAAADGKQRRVLLAADSLAVRTTLADAARTFARGATLSPATVDGRPALVGDVGAGARSRRVAVVVDDGDSVFVLAFDGGGADDDRAAFDAFLAGIDLDAASAAAK